MTIDRHASAAAQSRRSRSSSPTGQLPALGALGDPRRRRSWSSSSSSASSRLASGAELGLAGWLVTALALSASLITSISSVVEGRRKAVDRLVTGVVAPRVRPRDGPARLAWPGHRHRQRRRRFDASSSPARCATSSARAAASSTRSSARCSSPALAALISIPIGLFTAIYLVEYGAGSARARHHLPRRRDDRHPVDRRRPVRVRAVRAVLRPRHPHGHHGRGRPRRC